MTAIKLNGPNGYAEMAEAPCTVNGKDIEPGSRVRFEKDVVYKVDDELAARLLAIPARWGKPVFIEATPSEADPEAPKRAQGLLTKLADDPALLAKFEAFLKAGATAPAVADVPPPKAAPAAKAEPKDEEKAEEPAPADPPAKPKAKAPAKPKKNLADLKK